MSRNFVSVEKMSKRDRSELNKTKRSVWAFSPVSRVKPSAKLYDRKKKVIFDD